MRIPLSILGIQPDLVQVERSSYGCTSGHPTIHLQLAAVHLVLDEAGSVSEGITTAENNTTAIGFRVDGAYWEPDVANLLLGYVSGNEIYIWCT